MLPIVFLPGAGGCGSFWRPLADRLANVGPMLTFDYPGFGCEPSDPSVNSLDDLFRWVLARLPEGPCHVVAQSMGGVLAVRLAIEHPTRVATLVLVATSGGVDVRRLGGHDWREDYLKEFPHAPHFFVDDRADLTDHLSAIRAPTLLVWGDADPISPPAVGRFLASRIRDSRLVLVSGGTHAFANERPDEVAGPVRKMLAAMP